MSKKSSNLKSSTELDLKRKFLAELILMDDIFMRVVLKDVKCTEFILQTILEKPELRVKRQSIQSDLKNLEGRSLVLDCLCTDKKGTIYNIELQNDSLGASPKRARYHSGLIDMNISKKGNVNDELTLSLKEGSLSDNGAVFVLKNNSVSVYTYDVEYDVEVKTDNGWEKVEDSRNKVWTKELYTIDPNKTNNIAIDFSEFKDKMVSNKVYRVVKRFVQNGDTNKEITVSAEFQMR